MYFSHALFPHCIHCSGINFEFVHMVIGQETAIRFAGNMKEKFGCRTFIRPASESEIEEFLLADYPFHEESLLIAMKTWEI